MPQTIQNPTQPTFDLSIFEIDQEKQMVNLTKMAERFGKDVKRWSQLKQTQDFLLALENTEDAQNVFATNRGAGGNGTWGTKPVALKLAQWISPEFEVFCIQKLDTLFQTGSVDLGPQVKRMEREPTKLETLQMALESEQQRLIAEAEKFELETRLASAKPKVEYFDKLVDRNLLTNFRDAAKQLGVMPSKFVQYLLNEHYLYRDNRGDLKPYSSDRNRQLFQITNFTSKTHVGQQTLITPQGMEHFVGKMRQNGNLLLLS